MEELCAGETEMLSQFKSVISDVMHPNHDERSLLKWLKARNFDLGRAEKMYRKSMSWRKQIGADRILDTYTVPETMRRYYPGGLCGHDKQGRPVWIDPLGRADIKGIMLSTKKTDIMKTMVYKLETLYAEFRRCSEETGKAIDQCIQILDMEGFGAKIMWLPALNLFLEILRLLDDNYPETLKHTYIINAPGIFHMGWKVLKSFLNRDTANKFKFLEKNYKERLLDLIDPEQLPVHYGGTKCDPDGDPKCESMICYGGDVPKELYINKEDIFPSDRSPEHNVLGRQGTLTLGFFIPDCYHAIRYIFSVDWGSLDYGVYSTPEAPTTEHSTPYPERVNFDLNNMDIVEPMKTINCSLVPEDGLIFFEKPGYYCIHFRNASRLYRKSLTYFMEVFILEEGAIRNTAATPDKDISETTQF